MTGAYKITPAQAQMIRQLKSQGLTNSQLAKVYQVNTEHIRQICNGNRHSPKNRSFIHKEEFEALDLLPLWETIVKIVENRQSAYQQ